MDGNYMSIRYKLTNWIITLLISYPLLMVGIILDSHTFSSIGIISILLGFGYLLNG